MQVASRVYNIKIVAQLYGGGKDYYHLRSVQGTWQANELLQKINGGFKSYTSINYYAKKGKLIPVNSPIRFPHSSETTDIPELKGLIFWANINKAIEDRYFDQSPIKTYCIEQGEEKYKAVFIGID